MLADRIPWSTPFDSTMQDRTNRVINTFAADPSLSLHKLQAVIGILHDTDQDVVKLILDYETDVWNHNELFSLVKDYLETSLQTIDFCKLLENPLKDAQSRLSFLQTAIEQYDGDANHLNTLEKFKKFKALDTLFTDEFWKSYIYVRGKHKSLLKNLQTQMCQVVEKLGSVKTWKILSNVMFVTTFTIILICSVVVAAVAAPPLVTALAAAATLVPLGSMGVWVETLWKECEKEFRDQKSMMNLMNVGSDVFVIKDLENIKALVARMGVKMGGMLH